MRILLALSFCITVAASTAQTFDDVIQSRRYIDCQDVSFNAMSIISNLYARNQIDSIYKFINYWEGKCGPMESTFRLRNILDIRTGQFERDSITSSWIEYLVGYKRSLADTMYSFYYPYGLQNDLLSEKNKFDSLAQRIASETLSQNVDGSLLLDFYSARSPTFESIRSAPEQSRLRALYYESYSQTLRSAQFHIAFITGLVQNYGRISIFGNRPNFGIVMGGKKMRHNYDLLLDFRSGPSKEKYSFMYQDSLITGDTWTGMYVGFEYTFDFIHSPEMDIGVSPGIGYDRITALTSENEYGEDPMFLSSFNKNIGVVFKYKFGKNGGYLGLHLRYNWVDYKNPGGTPLDGQYLNVRVTIGFIGDVWRQSRLANLE